MASIILNHSLTKKVNWFLQSKNSDGFKKRMEHCVGHSDYLPATKENIDSKNIFR